MPALAALLALAAFGAFAFLELAAARGGAERLRITERALAEAREALIAYAIDRAVTSAVGPGYLPCPDLDDDGWAESTCGSLTGDSGQAERLGRLPWKTLGLASLRDGHGERLWYAVSTKYKGLLNCGASRACVDMSPDAALGTITVRDNAGRVIHDGTVAEAYRAAEGGAVAVVIAPGPPLGAQSRDCAAGDCANPANYLDRANAARFAFESNADFVDRSDAAGRPRNTNGFIQGPVVLGDGTLAVNDRLTAIGYRDLMPRIMQRVALEAAQCLRTEAGEAGRYPWPSPPCAQASADAGSAWQAQPGVHFGRVAAQRFGADSCAIASDASPSWWSAWRAHVFYATCVGGAACLEVADLSGRVIARGKQLAVLVAGPPLARDGFVQQRAGAGIARVAEWLEGSNARLEGAGGCAVPPPFPCEDLGSCTRITAAAASRAFNDVVVAY